MRHGVKLNVNYYRARRVLSPHGRACGFDGRQEMNKGRKPDTEPTVSSRFIDGDTRMTRNLVKRSQNITQQTKHGTK